MPRRPEFRSLRYLAAAVTVPLLAAVLATALSAPPAAAQDWVTFTDETATRLSADTSVGLTDEFEKDLIAGDVDNDGDDDLLIVRKERFSTPGGKRNVLFLNQLGVMTDVTATLAPDFLDETDDRDIVLADLDGDGWLDAVTVTTFSEQPRVYMNLGRNMAGDWLGFDYEAMDARLPTFSPAPKFCAVGFGDVTGNGRPDLFFVDYDNSLEDRLLINDGDGFFSDETSIRMTAAMSESVFGTDGHIVDVDGDFDMDIVKVSASGSFPPPGSTPPAVRILYNDGTGNFDFMDQPYFNQPYMVEPADFEGDGKVDVLYVVDDFQDSFLVNTGNDGMGHATWSTTAVTDSPETAGFGGNIKFADLDQDGIPDALVADVDTDLPGCDRRLTLLRGQGSLPNVTYSDPLNGADRSWLTNGTFDVEVLDVNKDGNPDYWAGLCDGNKIFIGSGPGIDRDGFETGDTGWWSLAVGEL